MIRRDVESIKNVNQLFFGGCGCNPGVTQEGNKFPLKKGTAAILHQEMSDYGYRINK